MESDNVVSSRKVVMDEAEEIMVAKPFAMKVV
jgi:hypothetical protein